MVAGHAGGGGAEGAGVEGVDPVQAAADADDLPAEVLDEGGVVGFGVAEDQDAGAAAGHAHDEAFGEGGFADAGLAEQEHARVGDQSVAEPFEGVEADDFAPQHVPADGDADGG